MVFTYVNTTTSLSTKCFVNLSIITVNFLTLGDLSCIFKPVLRTRQAIHWLRITKYVTSLMMCNETKPLHAVHMLVVASLWYLPACGYMQSTKSQHKCFYIYITNYHVGSDIADCSWTYCCGKVTVFARYHYSLLADTINHTCNSSVSQQVLSKLWC